MTRKSCELSRQTSRASRSEHVFNGWNGEDTEVWGWKLRTPVPTETGRCQCPPARRFRPFALPATVRTFASLHEKYIGGVQQLGTPGSNNAALVLGVRRSGRPDHAGELGALLGCSTAH